MKQIVIIHGIIYGKGFYPGKWIRNHDAEKGLYFWKKGAGMTEQNAFLHLPPQLLKSYRRIAIFTDMSEKESIAMAKKYELDCDFITHVYEEKK